jgi:hypothetical protein
VRGARHRNARSISVPDLDNAWELRGIRGIFFVSDFDGTDELLMLVVR